MTGLAMDTPLAGNALQVTDMPSKELPTFDRMLLSELARGAQKTFDPTFPGFQAVAGPGSFLWVS